MGESLRNFVLSESSKVSKNACEFILGRVAEYESIVNCLLCKNEKLVGQLEGCRMFSMDLFRKNEVANDDINVNVAGEGVEKEGKRVNYAVVVKSMDGGREMTSEEVRERVMKHVKPELSVRVKAVRKVRNGGLAIETVSERERKMIQECVEFGNIGLKVELPKRIGPKVIIYDVPNGVNENVFMNELYERNLKNVVGEIDFKERVRIVSRRSS